MDSTSGTLTKKLIKKEKNNEQGIDNTPNNKALSICPIGSGFLLSFQATNANKMTTGNKANPITTLFIIKNIKIQPTN